MRFLEIPARPVLAALALSAACLTVPATARADTPYVGEIMTTGINFCPSGWAPAEGQLLAISQNDALFSLLGTQFGGDGRTTFGLPDLRGRVPMGPGSGPGLTPRVAAAAGGQEAVTLTQNQLASHRHLVNATNSDGTFPGPGDKILAAAHDNGFGAETIYSDLGPTVTMSPEMISNAGASQPVPVLDPALVVRYCIALVGIYPSRN